jgi:hypothetical protein
MTGRVKFFLVITELFQLVQICLEILCVDERIVALERQRVPSIARVAAGALDS